MNFSEAPKGLFLFLYLANATLFVLKLGKIRKFNFRFLKFENLIEEIDFVIIFLMHN